MTKQPCIKCKHLTYDHSEFIKLRLLGDTGPRGSEIILSSCEKGLYADPTHSYYFLTIGTNLEGAHVAERILNCPYFELNPES